MTPLARLAVAMRAALALFALLALAVPARADDFTPIRDVRPTSLAADDTLIVECPGVVPDAPTKVILRGRKVPGPGGLVWSGEGRARAGDRVLVSLDRREPARLGSVEIEVSQEGRVWRLIHPVTLELSPASLEGLAARLETLVAGEAGGGAQGFVSFALLALVALVVHLLVAPVTGLVVVWERKIWARMQSRIGPNRVGPSGWLQWLADGVKMLLKEDTIPDEADARLFRFAPYVMWMGVFATFVVLPLTANAIVADMNVGVLFLISITSLSVIGILLGGWTSNSKWSLLGGMRSAAQIVSYELPAAMALLQVALITGSLSPQEIVRAQGGLPHQWLIFTHPFAFAGFFIYFIAALAEGNRTPFDLPEAESELVAGFTTEYSGFRYGIFTLAEWTNVYVLGAIAATLFLGGWNLPFVAPALIAASPWLGLAGAAVMITKVVVLVFVVIWIRATLPRLRLDQLMALCWKYLVPLSFAAFILAAGFMLVAQALPVLAVISRWATFLVGGVALAGLFVVRVRYNFRASRLLPRPQATS